MFASVKSKVVFSILTLSIFGIVAMTYYLSYTLHSFSNQSTKKSLNMLSQSIFQTMTESMLFGDPKIVQEAFKEAKDIEGIEKLNIVKSKAVIAFFAPEERFTSEPLIIDVLNNKTTKIIEKNENNHHTIRMIKPMIAQKKCLSCHSNAKVGYVLGAMDLVISLDKNDKRIDDTNATLIISLIILGILFGILSSIFFAKEIFKPLNLLKLRISDLVSGEKDLTKRLEHKKGNEFGDTANEVNNFIDMIQRTINEIKNLGRQNSEIASEIEDASHVISKGTEQEQEIVIQTNNQSKIIKELLQNSLEASQRTQITVQEAEEELTVAKESLKKLGNEVNSFVQTENELSDELSNLKNDADQIKGVLGIIKDIAEQTNLLSLNAAIEAARAGEHGRGFAVVADEVRKLAERTQKSLSEIDVSISTIVQAINEVSDKMNQNSKNIELLDDISNDVNEKIDMTSNALTLSNEVAITSKEDNLKMSENITKIIHDISDIEVLSTANGTSIKSIESDLRKLVKVASSLQSSIDEFKS